MDPALAEVISDLFTNLAAGWFGAAVIIPIRKSKQGQIRLLYLTMNVILGIVFLVIAYLVRTYG